jgi:hypothetical protein
MWGELFQMQLLNWMTGLAARRDSLNCTQILTHWFTRFEEARGRTEAVRILL